MVKNDVTLDWIGLDESANVAAYEEAINKRRPGKEQHIGKGIVAMRAFLKEASNKLSLGTRVSRFFDLGLTTKAHTFFVLCGPIGAKMLHDLSFLPGLTFGHAQRLTMMRVLTALGDLWQKELHRDDIKPLQLRVLEAVGLVELHLPASQLRIKLHNLLHLAYDNLERWGPLWTLSMFR